MTGWRRCRWRSGVPRMCGADAAPGNLRPAALEQPLDRQPQEDGDHRPLQEGGAGFLVMDDRAGLHSVHPSQVARPRTAIPASRGRPAPISASLGSRAAFGAPEPAPQPDREADEQDAEQHRVRADPERHRERARARRGEQEEAERNREYPGEDE